MALLPHLHPFVYNFDDPETSPTSGTLVDAANVCSLTGTTSTSGAGLCIKLRFTGVDHVAPLFLRTLQSLNSITSSSVRLPPANAPSDNTSSTYKAPWVLVGDLSNDGETLWTFHVDKSASSSKHESVRLTFSAVDSMQDTTSTTSITLDLDLETNDLAAVPVVKRRQFGDLAVAATNDPPEPSYIFADQLEITNNGIETTSVSVTLHLDKPRLGGLYSTALLTEVAPACSECTALLTDCNNRLECRAFSACISVLLDADLTLISNMLQNDAVDTSVDATWLLENCLSPSDGTTLSRTMREILVSSYKCMWQKHCPLAYNNTLDRQLVLEYDHGEQVLEFELVNGFGSLSFTLINGEGESTYEFMEDFSTNATTVTTQLDELLMDMYRDALSNVAMVESTLSTENAADGVVIAHLTIRYLFLGRLPLPFVEITQSGNSNTASVDVTTPKEKLDLRVISID
ncbi:Hypothetical protein PHPALM_10005 [Phytophthora palmivora]|uniref:Uncharacterized protein n=1 Tax=Phytophthora palmivora TaxID=4796 RepID=A0A2P4Y636_9STRA|nr:Hypothetical protein PHPALM_10005 [Phytophthora palmivora]